MDTVKIAMTFTAEPPNPNGTPFVIEGEADTGHTPAQWEDLNEGEREDTATDCIEEWKATFVSTSWRVI